MNTKSWKQDLLTIPNALSLLRLLLIPVYMSVYLRAETRSQIYLAGMILAASCLTDLADGWIARRFEMESVIGRILDPAADKLTQFSLIYALTVKYPLLKAVLLLFLLKEGFQITAGVLALRQGKILPGALTAGKVCTTVLFATLLFLVIVPAAGTNTVKVLVTVDAVFLLFSFVKYVLAYYGKNTVVQDFRPK